MTLTQRRILTGAVVAVALLLAGYLILVLSSGSTARAGTTVDGVDIGGLPEAEAAATVDEELSPRIPRKIQVRALDETISVRPDDAGIELDPEASVAPAYGRTWNPLALVGSFLGGADLPAVARVDDVLLMDQVGVIADAVDSPPIEPALRVTGGEAKLTPGEAGRLLDREAMAAALTEAALEPRSRIDAIVVKAEPTVSPEAAQEAVAIAESAATNPVTVVAGTVTAVIPAKAIGRALEFTAQDGRLVPQLDGAVLHRSIAKKLRSIEDKGRDATFKIRKGKVKVVKSKVGRGVSDDELAAAVASVLDLPAAQRKVTVSVGVRPPDLTTEQAKALNINERLSTFTQSYPYAAYRSQNIGQAAKRINRTLLMPGDTFSLNDIIKERTEENGYTVGYVVGPGGVFAEDYGGGVSTSATAAWTAAFYAGMERVQTVAHSIWISRYQPGLEATVAWGIFDLKFRNDTPNAVFITSSTTPTAITVSFWGTKEYDKIEAEFGERRDIVKYDKIYDDSDTCRGQNGVDGFTITVDRVFYKDGEEVRREPITTRYKAAPDVTCGEKPDKKKKPNKKADDTASAADSPAGDADPAPDADPPPTDAPAGDSGTFSNG
jgi:vancomycin resistance protein YoaR